MLVEEMMDRMSGVEFARWKLYYQFEPFGEEWKQTAYICTMIGNSQGGKKGGGRYKTKEFMPAHPPKVIDPKAEAEAILLGWQMYREAVLASQRK